MTIKYLKGYVSIEELGSYAINTAASININGFVSGKKISQKIKKSLDFIKEVTKKVTVSSAGKTTIHSEIEWLLDNWYIAEREGKIALEQLNDIGPLPAAYKNKTDSVIEVVCAAIINSNKGKISPERIELFLNSFQNELILSEKEMSAFISCLKAELVSSLKDICRAIINTNGKASNSQLAELIENVITSLRFLSTFDASALMEKVNKIEKVLRMDPAGLYEGMDESTRINYRREISALARKTGKSEYETANYIIELANRGAQKHIGYYIFVEPLGQKSKKIRKSIYIESIIIFSVSIAVLFGFIAKNILISVLVLVPVSEIIKSIVDFIVIKNTRPAQMAKMELEHGAPENARTICIISAILDSEESAGEYAGRLEEYKLSNRDAGDNLSFGILADLPEADVKIKPEDDKYIASAISEIDALNEKYGGGFYFFWRKRTYNTACRRYMGWERKRGAIFDLVRFLRSEDSSLLYHGDEVLIENKVSFIITLDSDTKLCPGSAKQLIGAAVHPLNIPVIDEKRGVVIRGRGILQPRISVELDSANRSYFSKIFAGSGGVDPYGSITSDIYQDLFGQGTFTGKGIMNVSAYGKCLTGKFPENMILSHDLLEGEYLNCGYVGDVELTDGYPYKVMSYFSRLNRWIRGDWQTLPWLFCHVKNSRGFREKNALNNLSKWKIIDNLRRSLVPVFIFASLFVAMLGAGNGFVWAAIIGFISAISRLLINTVELVFRRNNTIRIKYHSAIVSGYSAEILHTIIRLLFLPYEACVSCHAILTALFRLCITKKNMLSWVTAANSERKARNTVFENYKKMWASILLDIAVIIFSPYIFALTIGILWLLAPIAAWSMSRPNNKAKAISQQDKLYLKNAAADIWRFFKDYLTAEDNYLPPDNLQEEPVVVLAHRTSPTNIGFAMLSILAADDMSIEERQNLLILIKKMLETIDKLPKWNGHLYNWYDTQTLGILEPGYISTVDSGNFAASLIVVREALLEWHENELAATVQMFLNEMNFKPLFDNNRKLFYIGWDISKDKASEGWYDLLASEARLTSYLAIIRGEVPRKHWSRLGRAQVSQNGYCGMVSWTGTMFEYLMPNLILPCFENSMIYESSKFCVYVQKRRERFGPWGTSESAFYAFDPALNYKYKAHGAQRLALKRKMDTENVISPYSSFLALTISVKEALENIRRLEKIGMKGRYGFFEAVDFTKTRINGRKYKIIRSFMAHHIGMSLVSIDNVINDNITVKRFMHDREMASFSQLLQEKVPTGEVVLHKAPADIPEKPAVFPDTGWISKFDGTDIINPRCCLLSNGSYNVILFESGKSRSEWNNIEIVRFKPSPYIQTGEMQIWLKTSKDIISVLPGGNSDAAVSYKTAFSGSLGKISAEKGDIKCAMSVSVSSAVSGELRDFEVEYSGSSPQEAELILNFEPVIDDKKAYEAHELFSVLSLELSKEENTFIFRRRAKESGNDMFLSVMADTEILLQSSAGRLYGRNKTPELDNLLEEDGANIETNPATSATIRAKVLLEPNKTSSVRFAIAFGKTKKNAAETAKKIIAQKNSPIASRLDIQARMLNMKPGDIERAFVYVSQLIYKTARIPAEYRIDDADLVNGRQKLWQFGISGDLPIISSLVKDESEIDGAIMRLKEFLLITENGIHADFILLLSDGSNYRCPMRAAIFDFLRSVGKESRIGGFGGIHLIDVSVPGSEYIAAFSTKYIDPVNPDKYVRNIALPAQRKNYISGMPKAVQYGYNSDESFEFSVKGMLPQKAWSNLLTNDNYGFIATDAGTGHMWHLNSRENKINRWLNDCTATDGTEKLELWRADKKISLFADEDGFECNVTYGFGFARWNKLVGETKIVTTAFVPMDINARVIIIEADNIIKDDRLSYYTDLVLGSDEAFSRYIVTDYSAGVFSAHNYFNDNNYSEKFYALASSDPSAYTADKLSWDTQKIDGKTGSGFLPCAGLVFSAEKKLIIVTGCDDLKKLKVLAEYSAAMSELNKTINSWRRITGYMSVKTPDEALNHYMNGWAVYQTLACRIKSRATIYQCGGAYGFRDQLQDACALILTDPSIAQKQIILSAEHQYEEGDVQHWWHPGTNGDNDPGKGIRSRCSDDLLWLVYSLCEYVEKTGLTDICIQSARYLKSPALADKERERYEQAQISDISENILQHAIRAANMLINRGRGTHGLCLVGGGDWNDGMNIVGIGGRGESVWLTWFAAHTLSRLAELCSAVGDTEMSKQYREYSQEFTAAADNAWDGKWYIRGYYDDGEALGSAEGSECIIDSVAQSFAVLGGGNSEKIKSALLSAMERLYDPKNKIVKLFDPPFSDGSKNPGYIKAYCPGFRENGGQYTHAAVWLALALFETKMPDEGFELLRTLLPETHDNDVYKAEPYVLAADVSSNQKYIGLGGWTWYTGAAGWFYRVAVENLLGIKLIKGRIFIEPNLPSSWDGYQVTIGSENKLEIVVKKCPEYNITVNGMPYDKNGYKI